MRLSDAYPIVMTDRLAECRRFWVDRLGFAVAFEASWILVLASTGERRLVAFMAPDHPSTPPGRESFGASGLLLTLEVDDVDAEHARLVAEGVVHRAEPVDVEVHQADLQAPPAGQRDGVPQAVGERAAVGQPGQRVAVRELAQFIGRALLVGYIADDSHHSDRLALFVLDHIPGLSHPVHTAIGPDNAIFLVVVFTGLNTAQLAFEHVLAIIGMHAVAEQAVAGGDLAGLVTEHAVNSLGPIQLVGADMPVPGADLGKILAALEAFHGLGTGLQVGFRVQQDDFPTIDVRQAREILLAPPVVGGQHDPDTLHGNGQAAQGG